MRRLAYFLTWVISSAAFAQSFPVKKTNDEYVVTSLKESERYRNNIKEVIRDKSGLCWFHNLTSISSFDGINWKSFGFSNAEGREVPVRINDLEVTDDSTIWMATAEGMYGFNPRSEKFVPIKQIFPKMTGFPKINNCIYKGLNSFLLISWTQDGFYEYNWNKAELKYVRIDSINNIHVTLDSKNFYITMDNVGRYWGTTKENKGIWCYDPSNGEVKCSWKGEILLNASKRLQGRKFACITYSPKDDALLISYGKEGILERLHLSTSKSDFYTFSDDLIIKADTNTKQKHNIQGIKIDSKGNEWLMVAGKYIVKLDPDITKCQYIEDDPKFLPLGVVDGFLPETNMKSSGTKMDDYIMWLAGNKGVSVVRKRNPELRRIPFEKMSIDGIVPEDYINRDILKEDIPFQNMYFFKGVSNDYWLIQQNTGRPKLLRFNKDLHITNALINNKWRRYPAYFNPERYSEDLYIAILRPSEEPLDFRNIVVKDFQINLKTLKVDEVNLSFSQRIWRYGSVDASNVYWLFGNGYLYSFNPEKNKLDSIFITDPKAKRPYFNRIKSFNYPTVLHKNSSTFWISFTSDKELYKIDLKKKKVVKIFKSCLDRKDCLLSAVYQLYNYDSSRIYLKFNMSSALLNPQNDSVIFYSDLFKTKLPYVDHVGSFTYKDWLCSVATSEVNLQNIVTGKQKRLSLGRDFKGLLSELNYAPPVNDQGEIVMMSSAAREFVVFNPDSIPPPAAPGNVRFSFIKLNEKELLLDSLLKLGSLKLKYNSYSLIRLRFSDYSQIGQDKIKYEYILYNGGDTVWNKIEGDPELTFTKITPGDYKLLLRAENGFGDYSAQITTFNIAIIPPFTQTAWFIILIVAIMAAVLYGIYRYRLQQVKKLQTIRNNIASDLHDDIGSTLNSISIYSEVAKQQAGKEIPALDMIGANSRKIIESMGDIVWTINPENDSFEKIIVRMRSFAHQLLKAKKVEYTFEVDEKLTSITLPMQVRKNFYLVFKEAITNLVKYSGASKVAISLSEEDKAIVLKIRDNGIGIPDNPETQGNGLMNMKRRAEEIKGKLNLITANGEGTGVELRLSI